MTPHVRALPLCADAWDRSPWVFAYTWEVPE